MIKLFIIHTFVLTRQYIVRWVPIKNRNANCMQVIGEKWRSLLFILSFTLALGQETRRSAAAETSFSFQLFSRINTNSLHILQQYMPDRPIVLITLFDRGVII